MDVEIVRSLIDYCYTGIISKQGFVYLIYSYYCNKDSYSYHLGVSEKNVREILSAAKFLKMTPIVEGCEKTLEKNMDSSNCISAWKFAHSEYFKNNTLEYIKRNYEKVIFSVDLKMFFVD